MELRHNQSKLPCPLVIGMVPLPLQVAHYADLVVTLHTHHISNGTGCKLLVAELLFLPSVAVEVAFLP